MRCCQCQGIEKLFGKRTAAGDLKRYQKKGPTKATRVLIDALKAQGIEGMALLDIGGGIGAIQHELLRAGVASAICVEASTAYQEVARQEADRQGLAERVTYHHGDFVDLAPEIMQADIVTLDRVVCCYHDMSALVRLSSAKAGKFYALVYPGDIWVWKLARPAFNLFLWVTRNPMRFFLHPTKAIDAVVHSNGLEKHVHRKVGLWQVVVYNCNGA